MGMDHQQVVDRSATTAQLRSLVEVHFTQDDQREHGLHKDVARTP